MNDSLPYALGGFLSAVALSVAALRRGRSDRAGYYDADVYGMTAGSHRRFAAISAVFAMLFLPAIAVISVGERIAVPLLALWTVTALLYLASFARGASDAD